MGPADRRVAFCLQLLVLGKPLAPILNAPRGRLPPMNSVTFPRGKVRAFALVRDANGNPKIDGNPNDLPDEIKRLLTEDERQRLGVQLNADA